MKPVTVEQVQHEAQTIYWEMEHGRQIRIRELLERLAYLEDLMGDTCGCISPKHTSIVIGQAPQHNT